MSGPLHPDLHDRVALITGASRGIGKAVAIRLAAEGADIAVLAKTETSTDRLPGSIHDTAAAIRALGRHALPLAVDVRDEASLHSAIEHTVQELGRLDILINNAGAIWTRPILETPPKRFDLMMGVNVRAAYVACYYALPQMLRQQWGHILNMCPVVSTDPKPGKVAYMISKFGMAQLAIGLAAEHAGDNIAANTLWPRTIIESQASINWQMADRTQWRTPEILCDAACAILAQEPRTCTGRQWIDEEALSELASIRNFDRYWCEGRPPSNPIYIDRW